MQRGGREKITGRSAGGVSCSEIEQKCKGVAKIRGNWSWSRREETDKSHVQEEFLEMVGRKGRLWEDQ